MSAFRSLVSGYVFITIIIASTVAASTEDENFTVTQSMDLLWKIHADERNVIFNAFKDCQAEGFDYYESEYRWPAMRKTAEQGTLTVKNSKAGKYYLGVVVYDNGGRECYDVQIDGNKVGSFVADTGNHRQRLFFLPEPIEFKGSEIIVLRAAGGSGLFVVEDILLLATKPPVIVPTLEIHNLQIGYDQATKRMRATWLTTLPAKCTVHCNGQEIVESMATQNHRVYLPQSNDRKPSTCWVSAGNTKSQTLEFVPGGNQPTKGSARREQLKLSVLGTNTPANYPITTGIPFPAGLLGDSQHIRLLNAKGQEWPSQIRTLAHWPDGSVKVALVDSLTPPDGHITLEYGSNVTPNRDESGISIVENGDRITVTTRWLRMKFDRSASGLFTELALRSDDSKPFDSVTNRPAKIRIVDDAGQTYDTLGPTESLVLEEAGPLKTVVRLDGHHTNDTGKFFTYQIRFTFYYHLHGLHLSYRWGNDESKADFAELRSLQLELPVDLDHNAQCSLGTDHLLSDKRIEQWHYDPNHNEQKPSPWALACDDQHQVALLCRHFRQLYPKAISASSDKLILDICPELDGSHYNNCSEIDLIKLYYYLQDRRYKIHQGVTKTHEMLLLYALGNDKLKAETLNTLSETLDAPPVLAAPPKWYAQSGVFGDFLPKTAQRTPVYDQACEHAYHSYMKQRNQGCMYGMLNFGDLFGERRVNWYNGEYDHHHTAAQMFVRATDVRWYRLMDVMARHSIDVDLCHYHVNPYFRGSLWLHSMGHTGGYFKEPYQGQWGIPGSGTTVSHVWTEGMCEYYLLTGDPSALEAASSIANRYAGVYLNHYDFTNGRNPGWHLIHLMAVYRITNDPYYLNAARLIIDRVLERRTPGSGWARQMVPGHCSCTPRCRGACSFMQGVLGIGLREYYKETHDERIIPAVVEGARYVIEQMWVPDQAAFRYTSCPKSSIDATRVDTLAGFLLFAHELSGDPLFAEVAKRGMGQSFQYTPHIADLRWMPYITYVLDRLSDR